MEAALAASRKSLELSGDTLFVLLCHAQALAAAGKRAEAKATLEKIFKQGERQYISYYQVALVYVYLDQKQNALDALERAFEDREGWLIWLKTEPALDRLRSEERFQKLLKK
jgi:tetratricopeptide (TPR) repeat protein